MFRKSSHKKGEFFKGQHRFEHWYRDNTIYFITARCRDKTHAFASEACKEIFWDRFLHYSNEFGFKPIVVSLMTNHYHLMGYLENGHNLGTMMQRIHGSVAKLVNDQLLERLTPFFVEHGHRNYFDGCLRDVLQFSRTFRYVREQCSRHKICRDPKDYKDTRVFVEMERAEKRAVELKAFLEDVPYKRYQDRERRRGGS